MTTQIKITFPKEFLANMEGETVYDRLVGHGRWSVHHERVFKHDGRFFRTYYSVGATEQQDERPYEYAAGKVTCEEVFPRDVVVTEYFTTRRLTDERDIDVEGTGPGPV